MMLARNDDISLRFLNRILPERGPYIAAIRNPRNRGFKPNEFANTIEDLWTIIESADRDGNETYYACAAFKEARNDPSGTPDGLKRFGRTKHNASGARSFWLDIDVGTGKQYATQQNALDALAVFCRTLNLQPPIVVSSGAGLHVYWPLTHTLDPEVWKRYAEGLKRLCAEYGLFADPARTADISSVLRTPGTSNRKHGVARKVECDPKFLEIRPYAVEEFSVFLKHEVAGQRTSSRKRRIAERPASIVAKHPHALGQAIVKQCGQLQGFRDKRGNVSEPLWYAALGVLAFCEDGNDLGHEWSNGYPGYTYEETQTRLDRARTLMGATTCEHFHSLNPQVCEACPHWQKKIRSPITLGYQNKSTTNAAKVCPPGAPPSLPNWELTAGGVLKPKSYVNTVIALSQLGIKFRHNIFHNKKIVEGDAAENLGPELSDAVCRALRDLIITQFSFDPGIENVQQAAERACEATRFDPVCDYLNSLKWDAHLRLDAWLATYLGADDTPLNRSIGRKVLIAMVRRAREPGCKFDYVVVLEGKQGSGKSSALLILAGEENFSDQPLLHLETRAQQEAIEGVWLYELSELVGLRRTEIETLKSFISRTEDNARPAYGRFRVDQQRRCVFVGTTNEPKYLRDPTGNRRFWPVRTGIIDLDALRRDRDQLLAEAAAAEASGESLVVEDHLYKDVAVQQEERMLDDTWDDILAAVEGEMIEDDRIERISSQTLLTVYLQVPADRINDTMTKRLGECMRRLDWSGPKKMRFTSGSKRGYWRQKPAA
jgi:Virulence-associated protein E